MTSICGTYLKKATLEIERSSRIERDEANMERNTAGVTGILLLELGVGGWLGGECGFNLIFAAVTVRLDDVEEGGMVMVVC